ncbi:MAG: DUF3445 domain-containing protein [Alphaproteobacteria bacterium]|nr:DUF3445 domain-containing protein [Alphaproteobacteria bacterium]MBU0795724.1 DUF3445 domain-containing protein [Alphaproteobacteria bacterium]MBU0887347.1 DUF3445 domain-containing protein [Alphaproteobacteria bacterium]MBU1811772.1 DUF3445 domain-containing protein [Alphaproteobacteria bacterium]
MGSRPRYAPYADGSWRLSMGLLALNPSNWIEIDGEYPAQLALKEELLATRREDVFQAVPGTEAAQKEVLALLVRHLAEHFPDRFLQQGALLHSLADGRTVQLDDPAQAPLEIAGRLVQEDLCLMRAGESGYRLVAASLCFPASWRLADKLGREMMAIHEPVPGYAETLGKPVDRFFGFLKSDKPVWRANWSLPDNDRLFSPTGHGRSAHDPDITPGTVGQRVFIRVERQTLRRLPDSGDILFTIRTYLDRLDRLEGFPELARALHGAVGDLTPGMARYKSIQPFREALDAYLTRVGQG